MSLLSLESFLASKIKWTLVSVVRNTVAFLICCSDNDSPKIGENVYSFDQSLRRAAQAYTLQDNKDHDQYWKWHLAIIDGISSLTKGAGEKGVRTDHRACVMTRPEPETTVCMI